MKNLRFEMKRTIIAGLAALSMVGAVTGAMTVGTTRVYAAEVQTSTEWRGSAEDKNDSINYLKWMDRINGDTRLIDINIPGTHDSGTFGVSTVALKSALGRAQDKNIKEQLEAGVRSFDIRYKKSSDGEYYIYHGDTEHGAFSECTCYTSYSPVAFKKLSVKAVLDDFQEFLKNNPSETIIVTWSFEGNSDEAEKRDDVGMIKLFNSYNAVALFNRDKEKSDESKYSDYITTNSLKEAKLDDLRGKIVICNDMFDYTKADRSNDWDATADKKVEDIKFYVDNAPERGTKDFTPKALRTSISGRNAWFYNKNDKEFSTLEKIAGATISIKDQKDKIAKKMKDIEFRTDRIYGVVMFDYVTTDDTSSIINSNMAIYK